MRGSSKSNSNEISVYIFFSEDDNPRRVVVTSPSRWNKVRLRSNPMTSVGGQSVTFEGSRRNQLSQVTFLGLGISVRLQCACIEAAPGHAYDYFIVEILDEGTISKLARSAFDKRIF